MLAARDAARALADGFHAEDCECDVLAVADGGEGTLDALQPLLVRTRSTRVPDAFGRPRDAEWGELADGTAVIEAAQAIPFDGARMDVAAASSRGLGELLAQIDAPRLVIGLGGTATMDAGAGLLEVVSELPPTRAACDVQTTLADAPRLFGPQKGATPAQVAELTERFSVHPLANVPSTGAAGGLGAALAMLGAELIPGAELVLDLLRFDPRPYGLVVTGEGTVDVTTWEGKAPSVVAARCESAGVRCVVFGGRVLHGEAIPLSGDPQRAYVDLVNLGSRLGRGLATT